MSSSQLLRAHPLDDGRRPGSGLYGVLVSLLRRLAADRPSIAWAVSLLFVFKAFVCFAVAAFPVSATTPRTLVAVIGAVVLVAGGLIWVFGRRIPMLGFELVAVAGTLTTSGLIAHASTHGGMMIGAIQYIWTAIYAAHFFSRRGVIVQGLVMSVGFALGLYLSGLPDVVIYWLVVTLTIWSICLLLGHLSERMRVLADTDPLTGLLNRNGFLEAANREHAIAERTGNPLTLVVLDLNAFKQINDIHGHVAGDRLLSNIGRSWRERLRTGDILARHGGDEFVLLLPATSPDAAQDVLSRLEDIGLPITWSIGVSEWRSGESFSDCLDRADRDLYGVKGAQRDADADDAYRPVRQSPA